MLIKRLSAAELAAARPIRWSRSGVPVAGAQTEAALSTAASSLGADPQQSATAAETIAALQQRIVQLEASLEIRCGEARQAGYREGEAAGRNQANAQLQPLLDKLARSIQEIADIRPRLRAEAEADLLKLSLAIARKVLHRELIADPDSIAALIKVCLDKVRLQEIVRVRIHPQHHPAIQQLLVRLATGVPIELLPDAKLQLGGVVIETSRGEFDASVDVQLKEIERGLTDRLRSHA